MTPLSCMHAYYPACFLVKPTGGKIKRQEKEIEEIKLVDLENIPEKLAFGHSSMIRDYMCTRKKE